MSGLISQWLGRVEPALIEARPHDAAVLASVHAQSFRHGWSEAEFERLLSDRSVIANAARAFGGRGAIVGFVLSHLVAEEAEILVVAVAPSVRGRGFAGKLVERHLARLAALGAIRVFLEVEESNTPALRLYARAGFREVNRRAGYYRRPEGAAAALVLGRELA